ncbi:MAG: peptide chain release factor N(5)-glutamine methyltransferase [Cucumibacter sp.]
MSAPDIAPDFGRLARRIRDRLEAAGIEGAALDARLLVAHAAGLSAPGLIVHERDKADGAIVKRAEEFAERRASGEPVARIVGEKEFFGLVFALGPTTLVPRPETELLVEAGLVHLADRRAPSFLDLGTGSGCVAVAVAMHAGNAKGLATDASAAALAVARRNARTHGVESRVTFAAGDWYAAVPKGARFDLIFSNPPYISSDAIASLTREVREHDPRLALDGGADGLVALRAIVLGARHFLNPGGMLGVEIGAGQGPAVAALFAQAGLAAVTTRQDLGRHDRVMSGVSPAADAPG